MKNLEKLKGDTPPQERAHKLQRTANAVREAVRKGREWKDRHLHREGSVQVQDAEGNTSSIKKRDHEEGKEDKDDSRRLTQDEADIPVSQDEEILLVLYLSGIAAANIPYDQPEKPAWTNSSYVLQKQGSTE